jgi:hypothetical protein
VSILDILVSPGAALGCAAGVAIAALLHWLFPTADLILAQALIVVVFSIIGLALEHQAGEKRKKP